MPGTSAATCPGCTHLGRAIEAEGPGRYLPGMADAALDTLAMTRRLRAGGFDPNQADAIAEAVRTGVTAGVATRADIAELRAGIPELRTDLRWVKAMGVGIIGILVVGFGFVINMLNELGTRLAALETALAVSAFGG